MPCAWLASIPQILEQSNNVITTNQIFGINDIYQSFANQGMLRWGREQAMTCPQVHVFAESGVGVWFQHDRAGPWRWWGARGTSPRL